MLKDSSKKVLTAIKDANGQPMSNVDVAEITGLTVKQVIPTLTSLRKKEYIYSEEKNVQKEDGTTGKMKFHFVTEKGAAIDPDSEEA